jgi:ribosomal protein S18 acetylase RimI-like enzyme
MSERRSSAPLRRPETARPRSDRGAEMAALTLDELAAIERQLVSLPEFSGATVADDDDLAAVTVTHPGRGPAQNFVGCMRWTEAAVASRVAAVERRMRSHGEWPSVLVAGGVSRPPSLDDRLSAAGWMRLEAERVMWTRRPPVVPHLDPTTRLEAATRRSAAEYERLEREIFGLQEVHAAERTERLAEAVESTGLRAFLVRLHGAPVAVARVALGEGVAGLFGIGVAADRHRQGYGALVTAIATRSALATGGRLAWLSVSVSNEPAMRLYEALGYQPSFTWSRWLAPSG